jgi:hypothetical protein
MLFVLEDGGAPFAIVDALTLEWMRTDRFESGVLLGR